jgi:hypothetical protein
MKLGLSLACVLLGACKGPLAPELDSKLGTVDVLEVIVIQDPPSAEAIDRQKRLDASLLNPPAFRAIASLTTDLTAAGGLSELRSVGVKIEVRGAEPSQLAVEFVTPAGQVFDRQVTRLTGTLVDTQTAEFELPVAGTLIDSSTIVGTWHARFLLEGVEVSTLSFEVNR